MRKRQQTPLGLRGVVYSATFISAICIASGVASASTVSITISVADIVFDGTDIVDAGSPLFGSGDLAEADPIDTMVFRVDGTTVGTLTDPPEDLGVDIYIPSIPAIPVGGGIFMSGAGGTFDLLTSSAVPGYGLELSLGEVGILYSSTFGTVDFFFAGTVASAGAQALPLGLAIGDPISVTLSMQVVSSTDDGTYLTGFTASGSGEVQGELDLVPEPSTMLLGGVAMLFMALGQRKRNRC